MSDSFFSLCLEILSLTAVQNVQAFIPSPKQHIYWGALIWQERIKIQPKAHTFPTYWLPLKSAKVRGTQRLLILFQLIVSHIFILSSSMHTVLLRFPIAGMEDVSFHIKLVFRLLVENLNNMQWMLERLYNATRYLDLNIYVSKTK